MEQIERQLIFRVGKHASYEVVEFMLYNYGLRELLDNICYAHDMLAFDAKQKGDAVIERIHRRNRNRVLRLRKEMEDAVDHYRFAGIKERQPKGRVGDKRDKEAAPTLSLRCGRR